MNTGSSRYHVALEHQGLFDIADASEVTMRCDSGDLWITLDNDQRDIMLRAGEVFTSSEHRRALIYALGPSALTLEAKAKPQARQAAEAILVRFPLRASAA